jgi:hypothetical protein
VRVDDAGLAGPAGLRRRLRHEQDVDLAFLVQDIEGNVVDMATK